MKKSIVILQDNIAKAKALAEEFERSEKFNVVGAFADGEEGVKAVLSERADYLVTDIILSGLDGLGVLDRLKSVGANTKTVIYSSLKSDEVISTSIEKGAAYYVTKPCDEKTLVKRVSDLFLSEKSEERRAPQANSPSLDEKISRIFISVGIPPHIKGYSYLREGIKLAVEDPDVINNITKKLYPMIGEKYSTTPSKVERAIRHAIEVAWARGRINNINDLFGVQTYLAGEKPTNGEFIALIADKMLLEGA